MLVKACIIRGILREHLGSVKEVGYIYVASVMVFHIIVREDYSSPDELLVGPLNPVDPIEFHKGPLGEAETEIALEKILE